MTVVLYRVDERLIHGQVVLGWGRELRADRYVVVDDALADSEWEQELYRLSVADEHDVVFATLAAARAALPTWQVDGGRTVVLTRDVTTMADLAEGVATDGAEVNLGGIHHRPGRREVRPYLFLDDEDRDAVRRLVDAGTRVTGRDLPAATRVGLDQLLA
ncbi:MAG: PTS sugar transporter subunit IIB [Gemmatimonadetes bacterium]|nr:PTS sugar transporter subunit IIB [Gemmatimonadota bacterium]MBT8403775.1 PTS sugar transporter subunit IIB [Gemmatimonadota bacterium]NNF38246.1 PTS sugar transporter subunit IIB [Gemmatimonadota bacterium]NNK62083.1 PTS sugar transporter subunit IIB [Gemmatimonadota bacterium]